MSTSKRDDRLARLRRRTRRGRWRRWVVRGIGLVTLVFVAVGGVLAWLTINPRVNSAAQVDALLVLATQPGAHQAARELVAEGVTDQLIVSTPPAGKANLCADPPQDAQVECFSPEPATTQGEAMNGSEIARSLGAETLGVLTFDHHIERSRLLVERCWEGPVYMYEFQPVRGQRGYVYNFAYAMAAYGKAFMTPGCSTPPPKWLQTSIDALKG